VRCEFGTGFSSQVVQGGVREALKLLEAVPPDAGECQLISIPVQRPAVVRFLWENHANLLDDPVATKDIFGGPEKVLTQTEGVFLGSSRSNTGMF
jgi:hypothetical protein